MRFNFVCIIHLDFDLDKMSSETEGPVHSSEAGHVCMKKVHICSVAIVIIAPPQNPIFDSPTYANKTGFHSD